LVYASGVLRLVSEQEGEKRERRRRRRG